MLLANPFTALGGLRGAMYYFQKAGDTLPKHVPDGVPG